MTNGETGEKLERNSEMCCISSKKIKSVRQEKGHKEHAIHLLYKSNWYDKLSSFCTNELFQKYLNSRINVLKWDF